MINNIHLYQCSFSFKDTSEQVLPWVFKTIEFMGLSEVKNKKETSQGLAMNQDIVYMNDSKKMIYGYLWAVNDHPLFPNCYKQENSNSSQVYNYQKNMENTWIISNVDNMDISICCTYTRIAHDSDSTYLETNITILGDVPSTVEPRI